MYKDNKLPNFLIAGFAKCGTTSLANYLKNHEEIFICKEKELRYLTFDHLKEKGYKGPGDDKVRSIAVKSLDDYKSCFNATEKHKAIGEATADTAYFHQQTIPKIKKTLGDPKIIILLRDPVKRAISAYSHLVREEREKLCFEDALDIEEERLKSGFEYIWGYKQSSMYYQPVKAFKESFSNVKIVLFEDLIKDPDKIIQDALQFLEVNQSYQFKKTQFNRSGKPKNILLNRFLIKKSKSKDLIKKIFGDERMVRFKESIQKYNLEKIVINQDVQKNLYFELKHDIEKLEAYLNIDLSDWKKYE